MQLFTKGIDTEEQVLAIRARAYQNLLSGVIITNWTNEGTSVGRMVVMPTKELFDACTRFLQAVNPDVYGKRISKTRPFYTW